MNVMQLESRMDNAVAYLARLKAAMTRVDTKLWPQAELSQDLESLMARLNQIPDRVQEWKKSSARCGAYVALSLVRVHCKDVKEDKLAELKVANTKRHTFQSFMDTFLDAATRIADSIDLDSFATQPVLLLTRDRETLCSTFICLGMPSDCVIVKLLRAWCSNTFDPSSGTLGFI